MGWECMVLLVHLPLLLLDPWTVGTGFDHWTVGTGFDSTSIIHTASLTEHEKIAPKLRTAPESCNKYLLDVGKTQSFILCQSLQLVALGVMFCLFVSVSNWGHVLFVSLSVVGFWKWKCSNFGAFSLPWQSCTLLICWCIYEPLLCVDPLYFGCKYFFRLSFVVVNKPNFFRKSMYQRGNTGKLDANSHFWANKIWKFMPSPGEGMVDTLGASLEFDFCVFVSSSFSQFCVCIFLLQTIFLLLPDRTQSSFLMLVKTAHNCL